MKKNVIMKRVSAGENDVLLFLHADRAPSRAEWDDAMAHIADYARKGDLRRLRALVVTDGGGPDTQMRAELAAFYKTHGYFMKTAVVTTSLISRGIVAAVSWFNPHIKAFSPGHLGNAFAHLGLSSAATPRILREFGEMERELSPNGCLSLINGLSQSATL